MINKPRQVRLLLGAIEDYQNGLMNLQTLIWKINGLLEIIDDRELYKEVDDDTTLLEEINAYTYADKDYDFVLHGKPLVDKAIAAIAAKTAPYESRYPEPEE